MDLAEKFDHSVFILLGILIMSRLEGGVAGF